MSMVRSQTQLQPDVVVHSDASSSVGCAAWWSEGWFLYEWPPELTQTSIMPKETLPIVLACALWGRMWRNKTVLMYCDNQAAVISLNTGRCKETWTMHLIRCLFFIKAFYWLELRFVHLPGKQNALADALSSNDIGYFCSQGFLFTGPSGTSVQNSAQSIGHVGNQAARLDIGYLDTVVQQLFSTGLADSTKNTYRAGNNRYIKLCSKVGLTAYPATERTLSLFVASMYKDGLAGSTAKTYLAGVRYSQITMGMDDPDMGSMLRLEYAVKGFRKLSGGPVCSCLPITPTILGKLKLKMVWAQSADQTDTTMLWAAACMCFFGFLRSGESRPVCHDLQPSSTLELWRCKGR